VRELDNVIQRACLACNGEELDVHHLPPELVAAAAMGPPAASYPAPLPEPPSSWPPSGLGTLRSIESSAVRSALTACGGNVTAAARMLGVSRTKLYRDLKKG
jgi:transcriptional regulator of acetoin/glycerol metabolism